jgi:hypothetical protein
MPHISRQNGVSMGVRESLNENKNLGLGLAIGIAVIAVAIIAIQVVGSSHGAGGIEVRKTAFYTDDDGKTFFKDDTYKVAPFNHNGKQAYRADVFKCADGKQFVGLMYRHNELGKKAMGDFIAKGASDKQGTFLSGLETQGVEVKRPGGADSTWKPNDSSLATSIKCPSGGPTQLVTP